MGGGGGGGKCLPGILKFSEDVHPRLIQKLLFIHKFVWNRSYNFMTWTHCRLPSQTAECWQFCKEYGVPFPSTVPWILEQRVQNNFFLNYFILCIILSHTHTQRKHLSRTRHKTVMVTSSLMMGESACMAFPRWRNVKHLAAAICISDVLDRDCSLLMRSGTLVPLNVTADEQHKMSQRRKTNIMFINWYTSNKMNSIFQGLIAKKSLNEYWNIPRTFP